MKIKLRGGTETMDTARMRVRCMMIPMDEPRCGKLDRITHFRMDIGFSPGTSLSVLMLREGHGKISKKVEERAEVIMPLETFLRIMDGDFKVLLVDSKNREGEMFGVVKLVSNPLLPFNSIMDKRKSQKGR